VSRYVAVQETRRGTMSGLRVVEVGDGEPPAVIPCDHEKDVWAAAVFWARLCGLRLVRLVGREDAA
jgi:hypothetical protein